MQRIEIRDFDDPRLAPYRNLKDAELANRCGRFIVEGRTNLEVLLEASIHAPDSILLSERLHRSMARWLAASNPDCPLYVAEQAVLDRVVGFSFHRGCLATCPRPVALDPAALAARCIEAEPAPRILVLEGVGNHDNVGGIFRNARALGGRAVILCPESCDPLYRKAIRTSMGGSLCLPFARATRWPEGLESLRGLGYQILALDPGVEGDSLDRVAEAARGPTALLLGTEGAGLTQAALARSDRRVRIPMEAGVDSLNVAMAAGIALHALRRRGESIVPGAATARPREAECFGQESSDE